MTVRLPAHLEVAAIRRCAEAEGGFATVLKKGDRDGGQILLILTHRDAPAQLWERMPSLNGTRAWVLADKQDPDKKREFQEILDRRARFDGDGWMIEIDIADPERFVAQLPL